MITTREKEALDAAHKANPDAGYRRLARLAGVTPYQAETYMKAGGKVKVVDTPAPVSTAPKAVSLTAMLGRFDFTAQLRASVARLCKNGFVSDAQMRAESGIPLTVYRTVADMPEFKACQVKDNGVVWWGTADNANKVRAEARKWGIQR